MLCNLNFLFDIKILDARNPFSFRCADLEDYIKHADVEEDVQQPKQSKKKSKKKQQQAEQAEQSTVPHLDRQFVLILNKADLLTEEERYVPTFTPSCTLSCN